MSNDILDKRDEILEGLKNLKVHTNSLACFGCGREHNCGIHGCRILREAVELIVGQGEEIQRLANANSQLDGANDSLMRSNKALADEVNRLIAERDAAVEDLEYLMKQADASECCHLCKHDHSHTGPCAGLAIKCEPEWRGPMKEE